ncbi:MAG TPA: ParB/RepB/Spo0J family partition protein [Sphingobium sp.]|uniref:ParB/RepB/Spo0J family partition protein n=1 Tax=Sphingobium sp. TaxID=1912891 RepID=UPI002ED1B0A3
MTFTTMTIGDLCVSPYNVRKNERDANAITGMAASLLNRGQLHPLMVHPMPTKGREKQIYGALAGGRRLRAFRKLVEEGRLPADHPIDVIVRAEMTQGEIEEISLIENLHRVDLRPYERFAAVAAAYTHGRSVEEISEGTGQTARGIRQWIRLGNLAKPVFTAFAEERISEAQAMAFAATEDQALQQHAFEQFMLRPDWERKQPASIDLIRRLMKVGDREQQKLLLFVGEHLYQEAGGRFELDLFADAAELRGRVIDEGVLVQLADTKLAKTRDRLRAQAGRDLRFASDYPREENYAVLDLEITAEWPALAPEIEARAEQLRSEMEEFEHQAKIILEQPDTPDRKAAIAAIEIDYGPLEKEWEAIELSRRLELPDGDIFGSLIVEDDGDLEVRWWWSSRKAKRAAMKLDAGVASGIVPLSTGPIPRPAGAVIDDRASASAKKEADAVIRMGHGLGRDGVEVMRSIRQAVLRGALLNDAWAGSGEIAADYLIWSLARDRLEMSSLPSERGMAGFAIRNDVLPPVVGENLARTEAQRMWKASVERLKQHRSMSEENLVIAFEAFRREDKHWKSEATAIVAGCALERTANADGYRIDLHDYVANLAGYHEPEKIRALVEPTEELVALIPKDKRLEIGRIVANASTFKVLEKLKASELAVSLARILRNAKLWVHPLLFFRTYPPGALDAAFPTAASEREVA